jgi:hypothetical protein
MKKYIIIMSIAVSLVGCKAVKNWVWGEQDPENPTLTENHNPLPGKVVKNPDGSVSIVPHPKEQSTVALWPWAAGLAVLVAAGFIMRRRMGK